MLIIAGYIFLHVKADSDSDALFCYELSGSGAGQEFKFQVTVSKEWENADNPQERFMGAEYDGEFTNNTGMAVRDWELIIDLPMETYIDSSWNGEFRIEDNQLIITPVSYNHSVKMGGTITFGAVLYSESVMNLENAVIKGHLICNWKTYRMFWILTACAALWGILFFAHLLSEINISRYKKRQKRDEEIISQAMNTIAGLIDAKDPYTREHSRRVAEYSVELGKRLGMSGEELQNLYYIALMHDCGKIGTTDVVLNKNGTLSTEERTTIKSHTVVGGNALKNFTAIEGISDGAMYHHERYDGKGYPEGLAGEAIPYCARIICVADSFDTMNSDRCYRAKLSMEQILKELNDNIGKQFDPEIVIHMIAMIKEGYFESAK